MTEFSNNLPVGGTVLLAVGGYVLASLFVTGPLVGKRTIEKSDWAQQCPRLLQSELAAEQPAPTFKPKLDCKSLLGLWGEQGRAVCRKHGNWKLDHPILDQVFDYRERVDRIARDRLGLKATQFSSRCECAVSVTLSNRTPWALHAGSLRLMTPPEVSNVGAELFSSLRSPKCAGGRS